MFSAITLVMLTSVSVSSSAAVINGENGADNGTRWGHDGRSLSDERIAFMAAFGVVANLVGIAGSAVGTYWFGESKVKESKYTTDDIMANMKNEFEELDVKIDDGFAKVLIEMSRNTAKVMDRMYAEFLNIKNEVREIFSKLGQIETGLYQNVEESILGGLHDMKYNSSAALEIRATLMYDRMIFFMKGLLGQNKVGTDILQQLIQQYQCGSTSIYNHVEQFVEMMYIGIAALGYYSQKIPSSAFHGPPRIKDFISLHEKVRQRVKEAQITCADMRQTAINGYITSFLTQTSLTSLNDITSGLYERFDDIYMNKTNWLFCVQTQWFSWQDPINLPNFLIRGNVTGFVVVGRYSVIWAGQPASPLTDSLPIRVDGRKLAQSLKHYWKYVADQFEKNMSSWVTGRKPGAWLFFDRPGDLFCGASPRISSFRREYDVPELTFNFVLQ